ncbi:biotin/lipoyl-binding protein, partial [Pseudomonas aeruginosa]|nr:biotin/lipoyl-binding protein [Pseudomonas aeruginosa]
MADLRAIGRIGALAMAIALAGCGPAEERQEAAEMVLPVEVLTVQAEPLALSSELPGRIEPVRVAEVRARVAGIVVQKRFEEGADVKAGDLLFRIAPEPLQAELSAAEAEQAQAHAAREAAADVARRSRQLMEDDSISAQQYRKDLFAEQQARAAEQSAEAKVRSARLRLAY